MVLSMRLLNVLPYHTILLLPLSGILLRSGIVFLRSTYPHLLFYYTFKANRLGLLPLFQQTLLVGLKIILSLYGLLLPFLFPNLLLLMHLSMLPHSDLILLSVGY